jgi:hypothetical protein
MLRPALYVLIALGLYCPFAVWIYHAVDTPPEEKARVAALFTDSNSCNPEPAERLAYLVGLLMVPAVIFGLALACGRLQPRLSAWVVLAAETVLAGLLLAGCYGCLRGNQSPGNERWYHLRLNVFFRYRLYYTAPLMALAATWLLARARPARWGRALAHATVAVLLVLLFLLHLMDPTDLFAHRSHFTAAFSPVVAAHQGKVLLVNATSQYGLYPHFLQPLFALTGLSVRGFSAVMGLLTAAGCTALWLVLAGLTQSRRVALLGFGAFLFNGWFTFVNLASPHAKTTIDLYYQYYPIRFVFPAALVLLAWRYWRRPTLAGYWGATLLSAASVLWNLDTGAAALLSWLAGLCYGALFEQGWRARCGRIAGHAGAALVCLAGLLAGYSLWALAAGGSFPHYAEFLQYQQLFYGAGFTMLPLACPGAWMLVVLVYLAGLAWSAQALAARDDTVRGRMVLLLSVLGLSLFAYYQGRSHQAVLVLACWPCLLLLALFLDDLLTRLRAGERGPLACVSAGLLGWFLAGSCYSTLYHARLLRRVLARAVTRALAPAPPPLAEETALLHRLTGRGEEVVVLAEAEPLLYLLSGAHSAWPASPAQIVLMDEYLQLQKFIERTGVKVFVQRSGFTLAADMRGLHLAWPLLHELQRGYEVLGETDGGCVLRKRALLLPEGPHTGFHLGFREPSPTNGRCLQATFFADGGTFEAVVRPAAQQSDCATLVSNHPGDNCAEGFTIEQEGRNQNVYGLHYGDGDTWHTVAHFHLPAEQWAYLAVVFEEGGVRVHVNGVQVDPAEDPWSPIQDSTLPLCLGNCVGAGRPFRGLIREARWTWQPLSEQDIACNEEIVRARLHEPAAAPPVP